jgi:paraquat-inducible protein B
VKTKASPALVGAFVLGALALAVGALLSFSSFTFLSHPERFVVYFHEPTHGLDLGSPVNLRGVRVGHVVDVNVYYDAKHDDSFVGVVCELNKNKIHDPTGDLFDVSVPGRVKLMVDRGLRAQLNLASFATGILYVELDFVDPQAHPAGVPPASSPYTVIPSVPSATSEFQASAEEILTKIGKVDFEGLSSEFKGLLADARHQIDGVDLKGAVAQWKSTGASVQTLAQSVDLGHTLKEFDLTMTDLRQTLHQLDTQVDTSGRGLQVTLGDLQTTLKQFGDTAVTVRRFVAAQQNFGEDTNQALGKLGDAAEAVQRLADFLERNPNALLSGKKPAPIP